MYIFLATNEKLASFAEALEDEQIKSYNELLRMGLTHEQIQIRGIDLTKVDRDAKVFLIFLPEEIANSPLVIEPDFKNVYARYLTDKRYIYKVQQAEKVLTHFAGYIGKYSDTWQELELWRVQDGDYSVDATMIEQQIIKLRDLTIDHLDNFIEEKTPKLLLLVHK